MGHKASSQANGVTCCICDLHLPKNNWQFCIFQGTYCFYTKEDGGRTITYSLAKQSSYTISIIKGSFVFKYFRRCDAQNTYKCAVCFSKTQPKHISLSLDKELQGKGVIAISYQLNPKDTNQTLFLSHFKTRLRGTPKKKVDLTNNIDVWEMWERQLIQGDQFYLKSVAHGTYLRAHLDEKVDLVDKKQAWEVWTRVDFGKYRCWKSCHGTFLRARQNQSVDLSSKDPNQQLGERWID